MGGVGGPVEVSLKKCSLTVDDLCFEIWEVSWIGCAGVATHLCVVQQHVRVTWRVMGGVGGSCSVSDGLCK